MTEKEALNIVGKVIGYIAIAVLSLGSIGLLYITGSWFVNLIR